ncbi:deoxyribonuclease gamma-like [Poeciliopsis prolifica]|uniref:deoxyribonuclease gamma-like n=1 Tax=Poeciliopsis prolifica TaxID=188132 RepID=UPI0024135759|nr:deoxyribonuclease gamma-like [Poeciliopsis prolifica]
MKIAAFNIQKFGRSKVSDPDVLKILVKIISRYDIIVILEVVDDTEESVTALMAALNKPRRKRHYTLRISSRLGRTRYKEQFLFLYRDDMVELVGMYQSDDEKTKGQDNTDRDPYILRFRCKNTVLKDLVLIPVHTKPEDAVKELDELYDLFVHIKKKWKTNNVMILGDFNANRPYVSKTKMKTIRIRSDTNFHWLIGDDVDTTVSPKNTNSYDRIVVYGDEMLQAVVPKSAKAFNFQKAYKLSDEQAVKVSDHYPVEVKLKTLVEQQDDGDGLTDEMGGLNLNNENRKGESEPGSWFCSLF